jgi:hypothetical protein
VVKRFRAGVLAAEPLGRARGVWPGQFGQWALQRIVSKQELWGCGWSCLNGSLAFPRECLCKPGAGTRAFQSQAASKAGLLAEGNNSAPTRLRIAWNWVTLTESSGHSLQPLTIISFFPLTSVPSKGEAGVGTFSEEERSWG